jgi:hypothetical protein
MQATHLALIAVFIATGAACLITSNVIFYQILNEVNSKRSPEQRFGFIFANVRFFEIMRDHARLFPESRNRGLMYMWTGIGFALLLMVLFLGSP